MDFGGAAANWAAIGAMAAAATTPKDPKDARIQELAAQNNTLGLQVSTVEAQMATLKVKLDQTNAVVDDQAAQIVNLQGKVGLDKSEGIYLDTIRRLQATDLVQRRNIDRAEARASQLVNYMREHQIEIPSESPYFCRDGTNEKF